MGDHTMTRIYSYALRLLTITLVAQLAPAQDVPSLEKAEARSRIIDHASLFQKSNTERQTRKLQSLEESSGVPIVIETILSLKGEDIEEAALRAAQSLGKPGLFLLIAKAERRISRPLVDPVFSSRVSEIAKTKIREAIVRGFKEGDLDEGLDQGIIAIVMTLNRKPEETTTKTSTLIARDQIKLTLRGARTILDAAEAKATEMGLKVNIAVVDDGGHLLVFARMDGGRPASASTSQTKAISAATFRQATGPLPMNSSQDLLLSLSVPQAAAAGGARITPLLGGLPIEIEGQIIGGIGVGGGTGQQDVEVARAGIEALVRELSDTPAKK